MEFNTCSNSDHGISLSYSDHNTIANNNCSNNLTGIYLYSSYSNNLHDNDFSGSEFGILEDRESMEDDLVAFLWTLQLAGIIILVAGWRMVSLSRLESKEE
ncbi:MAG: NosD domain-containing protein [Candidatus Thorarchaeota archaeon]